MPNRNHTKKGRLSGTVCKELNNCAAAKMVERAIVGTSEDTAFARVIRMLGFGQVRAIIPSRVGTREVTVRIPHNKFGKRGATPITTNTIVAIFVGKDFDPMEKCRGEHFDLTAILNDRQAHELVQRRCLPSWMLKSCDEILNGVSRQEIEEEGFEWDVSEMPLSGSSNEESESESESKKERTAPSSKVEEDFDIDFI